MTTEADYIAYMEEQISDARAEGEARGEAKGKSMGKMEGQLEIARKMKALYLPEDQIAAATGLSIEEIRKL